MNKVDWACQELQVLATPSMRPERTVALSYSLQLA